MNYLNHAGQGVAYVYVTQRFSTMFNRPQHWIIYRAIAAHPFLHPLFLCSSAIGLQWLQDPSEIEIHTAEPLVPSPSHLEV
jgi:hypothetical protein